MQYRVYHIIAVAILIGAPLLVNLVSSVLPGRPGPAQTAQVEAQPQAPAGSTASARAPTPQAAPLPVPPSHQQPGSTDPMVDIAPTLITEGIAPEARPGAGHTSPPAEEAPTEMAEQAPARPLPPPPPPPPPSVPDSLRM